MSDAAAWGTTSGEPIEQVPVPLRLAGGRQMIEDQAGGAERPEQDPVAQARVEDA